MNLSDSSSGSGSFVDNNNGSNDVPVQGGRRVGQTRASLSKRDGSKGGKTADPMDLNSAFRDLWVSNIHQGRPRGSQGSGRRPADRANSSAKSGIERPSPPSEVLPTTEQPLEFNMKVLGAYGFKRTGSPMSLRESRPGTRHASPKPSGATSVKGKRSSQSPSPMQVDPK